MDDMGSELEVGNGRKNAFRVERPTGTPNASQCPDIRLKGLVVPELLCHDPVMADFIFGVGSHIIIPLQLE